MFIMENEILGLRQYSHTDDFDWYMCWQDIDTQKGYNVIIDQSFDEFCNFDINRFKFWVTVVDKCTNENIGTLRLGPDENHPDLAIWIYPKHRNKGYGYASFKLALEYIFANHEYEEISAGCYCDNIYSKKILEKIGFVRFPEGDENEDNCFTGEMTTQMEYRIKRDYIENI